MLLVSLAYTMPKLIGANISIFVLSN